MKTLRTCLPVLLLHLVCCRSIALAVDQGDFPVSPITNKGEKWRIGYYEGGEYTNYQKVLLAILKEFMDMGWIAYAEIPQPEDEQTKDIWNWLATEAKSDYLEFLANAHYSTNWDRELRKTVTVEIIERFNQKNDIDLILAMGTWAGQALANDRHQVFTVVLSTSDPLRAGIIKSVEDSGYDHVHARVDPFRYERQLRIFYEAVGFQTLGIAYEDTVSGKSIAALKDVENVAGELDFEIAACHTIDDIPDIREAEESVKRCFEKLVNVSDAIYVTQQNGINKNTLPELIKIFNTARIPTFSQSGVYEVEQGVLLSMARAGFNDAAHFHAETIAKIFNGAQPRQLEQIFESPPKLAINLATAETIGFNLSVGVLGASDEIYKETVSPD